MGKKKAGGKKKGSKNKGTDAPAPLPPEPSELPLLYRKAQFGVGDKPLTGVLRIQYDIEASKCVAHLRSHCGPACFQPFAS